MSLATRCTSCATVFRVVQDQLKVSEGWVRCGRCGAVFNALEGLFDLEPDLVVAAAPSPAPAPAPAGPLPPAPAPSSASEPEAPDEPPADRALPAPAAPSDPPEPPFLAEPVAPEQDSEPDLAAESPADAYVGPPAQAAATPASRVAEEDRIDFADARFNRELLAEAGLPLGDDSELQPAPSEPPRVAEGPAPEFLRRAERDARWARPGMRWTFALVSLVLALGLVLQAALHYRDLLVTLVPGTRPVLQAVCDLADCRIEALRRIDDIVVESSSLNALPGNDAFQLSVVLRNRGVFPLAMPAVELTLTDAGGQMLARRILTPGDFAVTPAAVLPPASETPLQLVLSTTGRRASGYTVEPFYP